MENSVIISVKLLGEIEGFIRSVDKQNYKIFVTDLKTKKTVPCIRRIIHTNRKEVECVRSFTITGETIASWIMACPSWENPQKWKAMSKKQKIKSYIYSFDEGFGVSYKLIDDGEI